MKCSIIIPVYNNANFTKSALDDLSSLGLDHEIIVVDNASNDHTFDVIQDYNNRIIDGALNQSQLKYIHNEKNLGFAKANNKGFVKSSGEFVLFLNNDIRVKSNHSNWTNLLIDRCKDNSIVGVQSGMLNNNYNFVKEGVFSPMERGAYLSGWCMMARRDVWDYLILDGQEGPWNEDFFLYFEDDDLSWRAKQKGFKLKIAEIPVHHFSRTTGRKYNMFSYYHKSRRIFKKTWKGKLV